MEGPFRRWMLHPLPAAADGAAGLRPANVLFDEHAGLIHLFLAHRGVIVEQLQALLNAQRKPAEYLQSHSLLSGQLEDCFFSLPAMTRQQARLRGQLEDAHRADGFVPRTLLGLHNGLVDPAEMTIRAFHVWQQTRWPGRAGRVRYAQTLFSLSILRCLSLLSMRVMDGAPGTPADRLARVQTLLDELWAGAPADQPRLVRDARWLIQLAQSPATDDLGAYFTVAERIADAWPRSERIGIHAAGARLVGGHLRSQIRYYALKHEVPLHDPKVAVLTRSSNALDYALMVQDLVPLLEAYEDACRAGDRGRRLDLADSICQGISPDPELFLNRIDLLGAYCTLQHLFTTTRPEGDVVYTALARRHIALLQEYESRIAAVAAWLLEDCPAFRPAAGTCTPYGVFYGFASDLLHHIAFKAIQPDAMPPFGLEDVFTRGDAESGKLAWVNGWRKLPHLTPDVARTFEYPQQFAGDVFDRIERELHRRASSADADAARTGRLFLAGEDGAGATAAPATAPDLPLRYIESSDPQMVAAGQATLREEQHLASDRREGRSLVAYRTPGGWAAISKAMLTEVLAAGTDAKVPPLPAAAAAALRLMCRDLVVSPAAADGAADSRTGSPA